MLTGTKRIKTDKLILTDIGNVHLGNLAQCAETFLKPIKFDVSFFESIVIIISKLGDRSFTVNDFSLKMLDK